MDRLPIELPVAEDADPDAARAVQELLGGRFGAMSAAMTYKFQSVNFRNKDRLKPYYDLVSIIGAETLGLAGAVAATIDGLLTGAATRGEEPNSRLKGVAGRGNPEHFLSTGQAAMPADALGRPWTGDYVYNSGDLVLDTLQNFFLECASRMQQLRVYEMTTNPIARTLVGYLLVRCNAHQVAWARSLQTLNQVDIGKMLNIPKVSNERIPECRKYMEQGVHRMLYRFSPQDHRDINKIWRGQHPEDGQELMVQDAPPEGAPVNPLPAEPQVYAPGYHPNELIEIVQRMM